ncbi:hypothetical protein K402DRAFT_453441 [Aulographum hederae CBS 113979]|uniref:Uncharacterized protein n=1 Tax=Aulographum hederae CBS 113979 TaxID=1176131 RepID=A0A6G1H3Z8_9PEZI|nr:hypothetical protein K402DRAFT_453441 [Aulographum hederae CBS 113979]
MPHHLYLSIHPSPQGNRPAHWALFLPDSSPSPETQTGTVIQVVGSPFTGYTHSIKHDVSPVIAPSGASSGARHSLVLLGEVLGGNEGGVDVLENEALNISAPGVSKSPMEPGYENCQSWTWQLLRALVEKGVLEESALEVLGAAKTA